MEVSMKKIIVALVLLSMTTLFANEYDTFVGIEYGQNKADWSSGSGDNTDTYGVRAGFVDDNTRIYLVFDYLDPDEPAGVDELVYLTTINFEAKTTPYKLAEWLQPSFFLGGHIGLIKYEQETTLIDIDETGALYGAQAGILFGLSSSIDLEIGYRYSLSTLSFLGEDLDNIKAYYGAINLTF